MTTLQIDAVDQNKRTSSETESAEGEHAEYQPVAKGKVAQLKFLEARLPQNLRKFASRRDVSVSISSFKTPVKPHDHQCQKAIRVAPTSCSNWLSEYYEGVGQCPMSSVNSSTQSEGVFLSPIFDRPNSISGEAATPIQRY